MSLKSNKPGIGLVVIWSKDIDQAATFYSKLGMKFEKHSHPPCGEHYATVEGECLFEIYPRKENQGLPNTSTLFGINVQNVNQATKLAVENVDL